MKTKRPSLAALYTALNEQFWDGQLPPTMPRGVFMSDARTHRGVVVLRHGVHVGVAGLCSGFLRGGGVAGPYGALGMWRPPGTYRPAHLTVMSPLPRVEERQVLLHEMVHCHLHFAGFPREGHGPRFLAELERLAARGETWATADAARYLVTPAGER
jgi:hypothetical protein